jgi:hypothetical protein
MILHFSQMVFTEARTVIANAPFSSHAAYDFLHGG